MHFNAFLLTVAATILFQGANADKVQCLYKEQQIQGASQCEQMIDNLINGVNVIATSTNGVNATEAIDTHPYLKGRFEWTYMRRCACRIDVAVAQNPNYKGADEASFPYKPSEIGRHAKAILTQCRQNRVFCIAGKSTKTKVIGVDGDNFDGGMELQVNLRSTIDPKEQKKEGKWF